jgi:hypothetical protein
MTYEQFALRKKTLDRQRVVITKEQRERRTQFWASQYEARRNSFNVWSAVFMLVLLAIALLPLVVLFYARFGK